MAGPKISSRVARRDYERDVAPRGLWRVFLQKQLHMIARATIPPDLRIQLYRWMGITVGRHCFIGLDTWLDDQFPELVVIGPPDATLVAWGAKDRAVDVYAAAVMQPARSERVGDPPTKGAA